MKGICPEDMHPAGHYEPAMLVGNRLYISGQLPVDPATGKVVDGDIAAQTLRALQNMDLILNEALTDRLHVIQCRVYVSDIDQWDEVNRVYAEFFGDHKPARVVVPVGKLHHGALVEIEAVAEVAVDF